MNEYLWALCINIWTFVCEYALASCYVNFAIRRLDKVPMRFLCVNSKEPFCLVKGDVVCACVCMFVYVLQTLRRGTNAGALVSGCWLKTPLLIGVNLLK